MASKDYYKTLEVDYYAGEKEIKKAFRRLALRYHPDKNPENIAEAGEKFKEINEAYEILGDKYKRQQYDRLLNSPYINTTVNRTYETNSADINSEDLINSRFVRNKVFTGCGKNTGSGCGCRQGKQCRRQRR